MFRSIKRLWETLTISQRRRVVLLTGAVVVMAILEVANVSAIAPFLALASDPGIIEENAILAFLYEFFGFDDVNQFLVAVGLGIFFLMVFSSAWAALTTWAKLRLIWSAAGLPVVVSNVDGLREVVGRSGLLFEPGNAEQLAALLRKLAADSALRTRLGQEARVRSKRFAIESTAERYVKLYEELVRQ